MLLTSLPCLMMLSLQQEKQNLCARLLGHWTKWVSSSLPEQLVHLRIWALSLLSLLASLCPLLELDTWNKRVSNFYFNWRQKILSFFIKRAQENKRQSEDSVAKHLTICFFLHLGSVGPSNYLHNDFYNNMVKERCTTIITNRMYIVRKSILKTFF